MPPTMRGLLEGIDMPNIIMADPKGERVYFNGDGICYAEKMDIAVQVNPQRIPRYSYCQNLKEISIDSTIRSSISGEGHYGNNPNLEKATIKPFTNLAHYDFSNCAKLKEVQLGDVGAPISSVALYTFYQCIQADLTITIYVADETAIPLTNSPFGATNATIIYRSSTTGEVRTE